jgi:hypothetical protein
VLPERAIGTEKRGEGGPEVSRGRSRCAARCRAEHERRRVGTVILRDDEEAQVRGGADTLRAVDTGGGGRNLFGAGGGAELATATRGRTNAGVTVQLDGAGGRARQHVAGL